MSSQTIVTPAAEAHPDRRRWLALALVVAAQFMVVLDVAIVNVALPSIKTDLHFTQESLRGSRRGRRASVSAEVALLSRQPRRAAVADKEAPG